MKLGLAISLTLHALILLAFVLGAHTAPLPKRPQSVSVRLVGPPQKAQPTAAPVATPRPTPKPTTVATPKPTPKPVKTPPRPTPDPDRFKIRRENQPKPKVEEINLEREEPPAPTPLPQPQLPRTQNVSDQKTTVFTDVDPSKYATYLDLLVAALQSQWHAPPEPADILAQRVAIISYVINPDGAISNVAVARSSGSDAYDQAAMAAVRNISPFDPLPPEFGNTPLLVTTPFRVETARSATQ
ncbi:TonB family protein [bacterium]|nr:TonB family protein [bacterium]